MDEDDLGEPPDRPAGTGHADQDAAEALSRQIDEIAERAEDHRQRAFDLELRDELAEDDFAGPRYDMFAKQVAAYGLGVMRAWILSGEIFARCRDEGYDLGGRRERWTEHDVSSLANETVTLALIDFREKGLRGGGWQYEGGRSLRSYFLTGCVYAFLNVYRSWRRERTRWQMFESVALPDRDLLDVPAAGDVAGMVAARLDAAKACSWMSDRQKRILLLSSQGYSHAEIAVLLDEKSARAVEAVLYRMKQSPQWKEGGERRDDQ